MTKCKLSILVGNAKARCQEGKAAGTLTLMLRLNHSLEVGSPHDLVQTLSFCLDWMMTWAALTKKRRKNFSSPSVLVGLALDTDRGEDIVCLSCLRA